MATRIRYALPIVRELISSFAQRLRPGGLARRLPPPRGGSFVIVTGAGRSGTSAVARVLHESGVRMGETFGEASEHNPVGFYEELPVCDLNDRIMKEAGIDRLERWPGRATVLAVAARHGDAMREMAANAGVDGWKDPRFSATLEAWLPHLPRRPRIIVCLRSPEAFVRSVTRVYGLVDRGAAERRWANFQRRLLDVIRDYRLDATCVEYERLMERPEETVAELSAFVGRPLDPRFVEADARHYDYDVPQRYASLYEEARSLGSSRRAGRTTMERPVSEAAAVDAYLSRADAIESSVSAAKDAWLQRAGVGAQAIHNGYDLRRLAESAAQAEAYVRTLSDAQREIASLRPPVSLAGYHELLQTWVDRERLTVELVVRAARPDGDAAARDQAFGAWRRFSSPDAVADVRRRLARERERRRRAAGLRAG